MTKQEAFVLGYTEKTAAGRSAATGFLGERMSNLSNLIAALVLLAPVGVGAGAGALHSVATSPSKLDADTAQKMIEEQEYSEALEDLKRHQQLSKFKERKKERTSGQRALRI